MKKLSEKRASTLIEVIISIAIFAAIALPLFSVFVQSMKTDRKSSDVLSANYISQDYIEKLDALKYYSALNSKPTGTAVGGYTLSAEIKPYGAANSFFSNPCGYVHIIMYEDGKMLAVMPDGKWNLFTGIPTSMSLSISCGTYTFKGGLTTITGSIAYTYCAMLINATHKPDGTPSSITLGTNCKATYYCKRLCKNDITITGSYETYENDIVGDTSLIYVKAKVYDPASALVASSEGYVNIKNW